MLMATGTIVQMNVGIVMTYGASPEPPTQRLHGMILQRRIPDCDYVWFVARKGRSLRQAGTLRR